MNNIDSMLPKCHDCPYWETCEEPYVCSMQDKKKEHKHEDKMVLTGKDLIKLIQDAQAENFTIYIAVQTDPLGVDYLPLSFQNVEIEDNTIRVT